MKINKPISAVLVFVMMCALIPLGSVGVSADSDDWTPPLSIKNEWTAAEKKANRLTRSHFDEEDIITTCWSANSHALEHIKDENGGYLQVSNITINHAGVTYAPLFNVEPGTYKFSGYFRTANEGELSCIRVQFVQYDGAKPGVATVYINDQWQKIEFYVKTTDDLQHILICGGASAEFVQPYCMDQFHLSEVDSIPEGAQTVFGTKITGAEAYASMGLNLNVKPYDPEAEKKYDVKGMIINQDDSGFLSSCGRALPSYKDIINFARQFEGTHITDYFICVNSVSAVFPSPTWTDYVDIYHKYIDEGIEPTPLLLGAHHVFETLGTDYVGLWHEEFKKIGINPWISFRMNDAHDMSAYINKGTPSQILSEFFYNNPQFYRVQHHNFNTYMNYLPNYTYPEVRKHYLNLINDALNRYDTYGIELDFQREMRLWHYGGEYNGLQILNDFMRDVDELVAVYEEKFGHEIKIAVRAASDPITCYDFGFDISTWAAEGIIDMFIPSGRYENNDGDIPVTLWCSMLKPFGVEVVMGIEYANNKTHTKSTSPAHSIETFAGLCSNAFSQGADKVYFYNYFRSISNTNFLNFTGKITTDEPIYTLTVDSGYWNAITSLGSPEKLLTMDRRNIISYNDTVAPWKTENCYVPATVYVNKPTYFRIPVGDVSEGSKLYVKFSTSDATLNEKLPDVYVNSQKCTFKEFGNCTGGAYTTYKVTTYEIPKEVYNDTYMLVEIISPKVAFETDYVEIEVAAHAK